MERKKISKDEFEREFKSMNASWAYEIADLSEEGKELVFKRLNGDISEEEFRRQIAELNK